MKNKNLMYLGIAVAAYLLFFQKKSIAGVGTGYFLRGDEVYKIGSQEPFGMVIGTGEKNVIIRKHFDGKKVSVKPDKLYLARDWKKYNN